MPARTDDVPDADLAAALLLARRGQAYFARALNEVRDEEFDAPSLLPGWTRRHVAAHVGYNARAIARLVTWAATGVETPMYASPAERDAQIALGATLPTRAVRTLCDHAAVHLTVEWRDLPQAAWQTEVRTAQGRTVPVSETVWMRTREVWLHAVDLDNGRRVEDFPPELHDLLLADLMTVWARKRSTGGAPAVVLEPVDRDGHLGPVDAVDPVDAAGLQPDRITVRGTAAQLVAWGTGRGGHGVLSADGSPGARCTTVAVSDNAAWNDSEVEPLDLTVLTGFLLRRGQQAHVAAWQREVSVDITSVQFGVLNVLRAHPGASQRELCDALDLDRSTIADIVARLQRRGLIHRTRDTSDKRRNVLALTGVGRTEFESLVAGVKRVDAVLTADLDRAEAETLRRILSTLLTSAAIRDVVDQERAHRDVREPAEMSHRES